MQQSEHFPDKPGDERANRAERRASPSDPYSGTKLPSHSNTLEWQQLRDTALVTIHSQPELAWSVARETVPVLLNLNAIEAARTIAKRALECSQAHWADDTMELAFAVDTYAFVLHSAGEYYEARLTYLKAAASAGAIGSLSGQLIQSQILRNAGLAAWQEHDFEAAYRCFLSAREALNETCDFELTSNINHNLLEARRAWGQELLADAFDAHSSHADAEAIRLYYQALEVLEPAGEHLAPLAQKARINLGTLHLNAGRLDNAEQEVYKALCADSQSDFSILARIVLMSIYLEQEDPEPALPLISQTRSLRAALECFAFDDQFATLLLRWSRISLADSGSHSVDDTNDRARTLLSYALEIIDADTTLFERHFLEAASIETEINYHDGCLDSSTASARRTVRLFEQSSLRHSASHGLALINLGIQQLERARRMNELRQQIRDGEVEMYDRDTIDALLDYHQLREGLCGRELPAPDAPNLSRNELHCEVTDLMFEVAQECERSLHEGKSMLESRGDAQLKNLGDVHEYLSLLYGWLIDVVPEALQKSRLRHMINEHRREASKLRSKIAGPDTEADGC